MKILHLADIHLNAKFHSKSEMLKKHFKKARKEALIKAFHHALTQDIKAIIIAGDFLDHSSLDYTYEKFIISEFSRVLNAGITVFYTTGNHDVSSEQKWTRGLEHFPNFNIFSNDFPELRTLVDETLNKKVHFVGCGHLSKNESRNLIDLYPIKSNDDIWIGIAHTSVLGHIDSEAKSKYMPTTLETLKQKKYDYFALGHIHKRQFLADNIAYSGSLEPLDITETGLRGGIEIEVLNQGIQFKNVNFNTLNMEHRSRLIDGMDSIFELEKFIVSSLAKETWQSSSVLLRLYLKGKTILYNELKNLEILAALEEHIRENLNIVALEIDVSDIHLLYDVDRLKRDDTILSQLLFMLDEKEVPKDLLKEIPGLSTEEKNEWWRNHKGELEDEIVGRLLRLDYEN